MITKYPCIILARGGSKGIPNKNLVDFCGQPLLAWSILQALQANAVDQVYVSSDSDEILSIAADYGAIAVKRPDELSTDLSSSESALLHALEYISGTYPRTNLENIIFLQATSPLRVSKDIDNALNVFAKEKADSLFSDSILDDLCIWVEKGNKLVGKTFDPENRGRRQDRQPMFLENGSIYIFKSSLLRQTKNRLGGKICRYTMPYWKSHEIDTVDDLELCKYLFNNHLLGGWENKFRLFDKSMISLMVYDFDGVMTDNCAIQLEDGSEGVYINRNDGWGVQSIKKMGIPQIILSSEKNSVVSLRGKKLGIEVIQGCLEKKTLLQGYCRDQGIDISNVLYIGNDVNDLEVMKIVGYPIAPSDAHPSVISIAKYVTKAKGGKGVVKEVSEYIDD